jgi:predicted P-loop ATPase/GTPase
MYPKTVVNLKTISPSLDYIKEEGGTLKIGAMTRLEDIAKSDVVKSKWAALAEAAHRTASPTSGKWAQSVATSASTTAAGISGKQITASIALEKAAICVLPWPAKTATIPSSVRSKPVLR